MKIAYATTAPAAVLIYLIAFAMLCGAGCGHAQQEVVKPGKVATGQASESTWISPLKGPLAAVAFELRYKGDCCNKDDIHCFPKATGIPLSDCKNIIPMTADLWTPQDLCADFERRMSSLPTGSRKKAILVMLKTERCATKFARVCSVTTAALEKGSTPLVDDFLVYGVQLLPRDNDEPAGSLPIETGSDEWKNKAAAEYNFEQGPGATLVCINPDNAFKIVTSNATELHLLEKDFLANKGRTPALHRMLSEALVSLGVEPAGARIH